MASQGDACHPWDLAGDSPDQIQLDLGSTGATSSWKALGAPRGNLIPGSGVLWNVVRWDLAPPVPRSEEAQARGTGGSPSLGTPHKPSLNLAHSELTHQHWGW